jgi:hypothetical protein
LSLCFNGLGLDAQASWQIGLAQPEGLVKEATGLFGQPGPSLGSVELDACGLNTRSSAPLIGLDSVFLKDHL